MLKSRTARRPSPSDRGYSERRCAGLVSYKKAPAKPGPSIAEPQNRSARIEFDDQMRLHLHCERHVGQRGDADEFRCHLGMIDLEEIRPVALGKLNGFQHRRKLLGGFLDLD